MFTCGNSLGLHNLEVPLDTNGEITLYGFVSGFSPFKAILTPAQAQNYDINMTRAAAGSREIQKNGRIDRGGPWRTWIGEGLGLAWNGRSLARGVGSLESAAVAH